MRSNFFDFHTQTTGQRHTKGFFLVAGTCDSFIGFPYTPKSYLTAQAIDICRQRWRCDGGRGEPARDLCWDLLNSLENDLSVMDLLKATNGARGALSRLMHLAFNNLNAIGTRGCGWLSSSQYNWFSQLLID